MTTTSTSGWLGSAWRQWLTAGWWRRHSTTRWRWLTAWRRRLHTAGWRWRHGAAGWGWLTAWWRWLHAARWWRWRFTARRWHGTLWWRVTTWRWFCAGRRWFVGIRLLGKHKACRAGDQACQHQFRQFHEQAPCEEHSTDQLLKVGFTNYLPPA